MVVDPGTPFRLVRDEGRVLFCSARCVEAFRADPQRYGARAASERREAASGPEYTCRMHPDISKRGPGKCPSCEMPLEPVRSAADIRTEWTCAMHPEVVGDAPGDCPKCGMALEPRTATVEPDESAELRVMTRRLWGAALMTVPLLVLAIGELIAGDLFARLASPLAIQVAEAVLATPVVLWAGWPLLVRAVRSVRTGHLNVFTLIGLGVSTAYVFSVVATVAPGILPGTFRDASGAVGVYFAAAAVIVTLVLVGQVLELRARSRTGAAIRALLGLVPQDGAARPLGRERRDGRGPEGT